MSSIDEPSDQSLIDLAFSIMLVAACAALAILA